MFFQTGIEKYAIEQPAAPRSICVTQNGNWAVVGLQNGAISIFDISIGHILLQLGADTMPLRCICIAGSAHSTLQSLFFSRSNKSLAPFDVFKNNPILELQPPIKPMAADVIYSNEPEARRKLSHVGSPSAMSTCAIGSSKICVG